MLSIQKFANLCHCTTQKLRFYDKVGVLKPFFIEKSTHYRYYLEKQAIDFYNIKELQEIGCSLQEIKSILNKSDKEILMMIDKKYAEQRRILEKTELLKATYLKKKMQLEQQIRNNTDENRLTIQCYDHFIILKRCEDQVQLKIHNEVDALFKLLEAMQSQILIGIDNLHDLETNRDWHSTELSKDWHDAKELITKIPVIDKKERMIVHFFLISENISLFDIQQVIEGSMEKGYTGCNMLFYVSLSEDAINQHMIIYTDGIN